MRSLIRIAGSVACLSSAATAVAQRQATATDPLRAEYTVEVKPAERMFHVTVRFSHVSGQSLEVALPVWTPGVYSTKNYQVNMRRFTTSDSAGHRLLAPRSAPSAWRVETQGQTTIVIEFDYLANDLTENGAGITPEYAVFTGTQLFLEPVGHRQIPSTVRFIVPAGWSIVSALHDTPDSSVFTASNYDELVDAPAILGSVAVTRFEVDGKPHFIARAPASAQFPDIANKVSDLRKIIATERAIFGSLPYDKYVFFSAADLEGGALEHGNSYLASHLSTINAAHEFFHLWNVKRIRGAEMWPYDYSRVRPGPSLWVAEGVTSYYERLVGYRAGFRQFADAPRDGIGNVAEDTIDAARGGGEMEMLRELSFRIGALEGSTERRFISPADASISAGSADAGPNYYTSGAVLGVLLDISILRDTDGKRSLDDVMRTLYSRFYLRGRGYTMPDLANIVSEVAGRDYTGFFRRYVTGTEDFPIDSVFADAGYRITRSTRTLGVLGGIINAGAVPLGRRVNVGGGPQSAAGRAGIVRGDIITAVDGVPIHQIPLAGLYGRNWIGGRFLGRAGERVILTVMRDTTQRQVTVTLGSVQDHNLKIEHDPAATPAQLATRAAWLRR